MLPTIRFFVIMLIFTLWPAFSSSRPDTMPDNAIVLLDDQNHTYLSPHCANQEKKEYRLATAAEARKLNYEPDKKCQDARGIQPG